MGKYNIPQEELKFYKKNLVWILKEVKKDDKVHTSKKTKLSD